MSTVSTPHAPLGAHASFHFGPPGAPAGFALPADATPAESVFVGCRHGESEPWSLLPFFAPTPAGPPPLPKGRFGRFVAWSGDKWMIGPLVFKLCTPFALEPDGDERFGYAPLVCGYLEYDNTHSADHAALVFGLGTAAAALPGTDGLAGFSCGDTHGFATTASTEVTPCRDAAIFGADIGPAVALRFAVPPHSKRLFPLGLAFFQPGFHHATLFANLVDVLAYGLAQHGRYIALSDQRDGEFMRSAKPFDGKTAAAQATRAWLAGTRRLAGEPAIDLAPLREIARAV